MAVIHKKVSVTESKTSDFKILNMTYNMGQSDIRAFKDQPQLILQNVKEFDLVAICA